MLRPVLSGGGRSSAGHQSDTDYRQRRKSMASKLARLCVALALVLATLGGSFAAPTEKDNKMSYHGGPLEYATPGVYFVWYGCWGISGCGNALAPYNDAATMNLIDDFAQNLG